MSTKQPAQRTTPAPQVADEPPRDLQEEADVSVSLRVIDVSIVGGSAAVQQQLRETCGQMAKLLGVTDADSSDSGTAGGSHV